MEHRAITEEAILAKVREMGGEIENSDTIGALATTIAQKLAEKGVQMRDDGQMVETHVLADASIATNSLFTMQLALTAFNRDTVARSDEPEIASERKEASETHGEILAVQAAIASLLGVQENPSIEYVQQLRERRDLMARQAS